MKNVKFAFALHELQINLIFVHRLANKLTHYASKFLILEKNPEENIIWSFL